MSASSSPAAAESKHTAGSATPNPSSNAAKASTVPNQVKPNNTNSTASNNQGKQNHNNGGSSSSSSNGGARAGGVDALAPAPALPPTGPPLGASTTVSYPVVFPQQFGANRSYLLPTAVVPPLAPLTFPPPLQQPQQQQLQQAPFYAWPQFPNPAPYGAFGSQSLYTNPPQFMPFLMPPQQQQQLQFQQQQQQQQPLLLTAQQLQQLQQRDQFLRQLQASATSPQGKSVPAAQQKTRDFSMDTYLYDTWRDRSQHPGLYRQLQQQHQRGSGFYSADELQLIPLQRISTPNAAAAIAAAPGAPADTSLVAVTVTGSALPTQAQPGAQAGAQQVGGVGTQTAMGAAFQDVPRVRLGADQDNYFAGLFMTYSLLSGLLKMDQSLEDACRPFDIDEDTIAVTETQLETLLYNISDKQQNNVKPLLFTFPIHERYLPISLRIFVYGEVLTDPRTGFRRALTTLQPFTWRQALPTGDSSLRLRGENISTTSEEYLLRKRYHEFLVRFYSMIWRSLMRLRVEQTALFTPDYSRFIEATLSGLRPAAQSVAVLEARIRALVTRLQLLHGVMFNTAQFYPAADALKNVLDPILLLFISRYLYFKA